MSFQIESIVLKHKINLFYLIELSDLSVTRGATHRHIVLAVRHEGKWGAMGLSRRSCLMKKPIEFDSLTDLIRNFDDSYVSGSRDELVESDIVK
jgi:Vasohibin